MLQGMKRNFLLPFLQCTLHTQGRRPAGFHSSESEHPVLTCRRDTTYLIVC